MARGQYHIPQKLRKWFELMPDWTAEVKQDKLDRFIIRIFPAFIIACFLFSLVLFLIEWGDHTTVGHFLYSLCSAYAAGFTALGIPVLFLSEHTVVKNRYVMAMGILLSVLTGALLWLVFGDSGGVNNFISGFYLFIDRSGLDLSLQSVILGVMVLFFVISLASYGVIAVVVAYFRKHYHRILLSLERNDDSKFCRSSRKFFMVPSVIDVSEVVLEPEVTDDRFQKDVFVRLWGYEMVIGLVIASYLFLNPVFLKSIPYAEMMIIIMLLSLFVSAMVIPVSILRSLGAKANSTGNRPYVLWTGMKNKMFHPSFYVALFLTLMWVSVYTDMDGLRILHHYVGYVVFLGLLSAVVSFIYVNSFYVPFKNGIVRNFYLKKNKK